MSALDEMEQRNIDSAYERGYEAGDERGYEAGVIDGYRKAISELGEQKMTSTKCCNTCLYEDKFVKVEEPGIDEPYLCTKNAKDEKSLAGCRTVTRKERCEIMQNGCNDYKVKVWKITPDFVRDVLRDHL